MRSALTFRRSKARELARASEEAGLGRRGFGRPSLVSIGDQSQPMFPAIAERVAAALPSASRHTFVGAGHVPHATHPDAFVACVSAFTGAH